MENQENISIKKMRIKNRMEKFRKKILVNFFSSEEARPRKSLQDFFTVFLYSNCSTFYHIFHAQFSAKFDFKTHISVNLQQNNYFTLL